MNFLAFSWSTTGNLYRNLNGNYEHISSNFVAGGYYSYEWEGGSIIGGNYFAFKKYKTFFVFIYNCINTSGDWKNEKLCRNCVFTKFRVFPISNDVDITVYSGVANQKCLVLLRSPKARVL